MILIVGAGPIGCYLGYILAKNGYDVSIYEEHSVVGKPVHCTGIISKNLAKLMPIEEEFLINKIRGAKVYGPKMTHFEVSKRDTQAYVIEREKFDLYWLKMAKKMGCKVVLKHRFISHKNNYAIFSNGKKVKYDVLIGADGSLSSVAKSAGMFGKRRFLYGIQARLKTKSNPDKVSLHLGSIAPGLFAWEVPESTSISRIGLAMKHYLKPHFNKFIRNKGEIIELQGGLIPLFNPRQKLQKGNIYLVGDAATQVKATTGGGVVVGMLSARALARSLIENKNYTTLFRKTIGKDLTLALMIRQMLDKISDSDYNKLVSMLSHRNAQRTLEIYGDMDFPTRFMFRLLLSQPRLFYFSKYFIEFVQVLKHI